MDKRVDPDCWLRSGFESPRRQLGFKPLSGSNQLRTLHCRATLICASFGGLIIYYHFPFFFFLIFRSEPVEDAAKCWTIHLLTSRLSSCRRQDLITTPTIIPTPYPILPRRTMKRCRTTHLHGTKRPRLGHKLRIWLAMVTSRYESVFCSFWTRKSEIDFIMIYIR